MQITLVGKLPCTFRTATKKQNVTRTVSKFPVSPGIHFCRQNKNNENKKYDDDDDDVLETQDDHRWWWCAIVATAKNFATSRIDTYYPAAVHFQGGR